MKRELSWAEHRAKKEELYFPTNKSGKTPKYMDGTNVRAKTCECLGSKTFDSSEGRCVKCGREAKHGGRYRL